MLKIVKLKADIQKPKMQKQIVKERDESEEERCTEQLCQLAQIHPEAPFQVFKIRRGKNYMRRVRDPIEKKRKKIQDHQDTKD